MKKPANLRAHLTSWLPDLAANPDKLHLFIDKGRIVARYGQTLSFEYRYQLQLVVTDFAESADTLIVPLLAWIATHQPSLLLDPVLQEKIVSFEAEPIDHDKVDIALTLDLSERVLVTATDTGYNCEHLDEPPLPDLTGPTGWQMFANGTDVQA